MRGKSALLPVGFAIAFGIINGYSIFQPLVVEERLKTLQEKGAPEAVSSMASQEKKTEAVQIANVNERAAKTVLQKLKTEEKPASN